MVKKIVKIVVILYVMLNVGLYFFQEKLIFRPEKLTHDYAYTFDKEFEEININTDDNSVLNALHFKVENSKGIILYFHGNKGNLQRWGNVVSPFTDYGYDVFVMDYRGYGKSTGKFNEVDMYNDAQFCYDYLKKQYSEKDIIAYGRSLGATFATSIASKNNLRQLILEAPFFNLIGAAKHQYFFIPKLLLKYKFNTNKYIKKVNCPIMVFHGTEDWITPYEGGKLLLNEATSKEKEFVTIEGGSHNNLMEYELYKEKVKKFLN